MAVFRGRCEARPTLPQRIWAGQLSANENRWLGVVGSSSKVLARADHDRREREPAPRQTGETGAGWQKIAEVAGRLHRIRTTTLSGCASLSRKTIPGTRAFALSSPMISAAMASFRA